MYVPLQRSYFMTLKTMYTIGYCTSLVTLTIALAVLVSFRWGEASLVCVWPGLLVISADTDPSVGFQGKLKIEVFLKTFTEVSDKNDLWVLSPRKCQGCSSHCALLSFPKCSWMYFAACRLDHLSAVVFPWLQCPLGRVSFPLLFFSPLETVAKTLLQVLLHWLLGRCSRFTAATRQSAYLHASL